MPVVDGGAAAQKQASGWWWLVAPIWYPFLLLMLLWTFLATQAVAKGLLAPSNDSRPLYREFGLFAIQAIRGFAVYWAYRWIGWFGIALTSPVIWAGLVTSGMWINHDGNK